MPGHQNTGLGLPPLLLLLALLLLLQPPSPASSSSPSALSSPSGNASSSSSFSSAAANFYLAPSSCDFNTAYLNVSSSSRAQHHCAPCPLGANCDGHITWSGVRAKFGWYRFHARQQRRPHQSNAAEFPPPCLADPERSATAPSCAFVPCIFPAACLGAANSDLAGRFFEYEYDDDGVLVDAAGTDVALVTTHNESCDIAKGYANNCTDTLGNPSRCRLCATCSIGYKRVGGSAECKKCPPPATNRALLGVGFAVCIAAIIFVIYTTIRAELLKGSGSSRSAVKKILLNFVSMVSLAGGLPLNWPAAIQDIFSFFDIVSSAGGNLLIPDCELTSMKTADAYYVKQIVYACFIPFIVLLCSLSWVAIYRCCRRDQADLTSKSIVASWTHAKNATVMTIVLLLFLIYPYMVQLCLSILKCPFVADKMYLAADLQEPCFEGRHLIYLLVVSTPQLVVYIVGLPLIATLIILRAGTHRLRSSHEMQMRYGLLYMGFRAGREWWELVIIFRKVAMVVLTTFGLALRSVPIQACVSLIIIFASIIAHLLGRPFGSHTGKAWHLHMLELMALTVVWLINWCGLLLYLGTSKGASESLRYEHVVSVIIVASIAAYIIGATEFLYKDYCRKNRNKFINRVHSRIKSGRSIKGGDAAAAGAEGAKDPDDNNAETSVVKIRPANVLPPRGNQNAKYGSKNLENRTGGKASTTKNKSPGADGGSAGDGPLSSRPVMPEKFTSMPQDWRGQRRKSRKKKKHDDFESKVRNSFHARKRASHIRVAKKIHSEHLAHDRLLREKQKVEQEKAHDKVMARVEARKKLRESRKLRQVGTFEGLDDKALVEIIKRMSCKMFEKDQVIVSQGDIADQFFVITSGTCSVWRKDFQHLTQAKEIALLEEWAFFGEAACHEAAKDWRRRNDSQVIKRLEKVILDDDEHPAEGIGSGAGRKDKDSSHQDDDSMVALRNATVIAASDSVTLLSLSNAALQELFYEDLLDADKMLEHVRETHVTRESLVAARKVWAQSKLRRRPAPEPPAGPPPALEV